MSVTKHCSLLNWIVKLDPQLTVKLQDQSVKVRPKPYHIPASNSVTLNEKALDEFKDFLSSASECIQKSHSFSSTAKQYSKLALLQQEMLNYPHLVRDEVVQFYFAKLLADFCNQSFSDHRSEKLAKFWCYRNFKKLLVLISSEPFRSNVSALKRKNILMEKESDFETHLCSLLELPTSIMLLKVFVLFCNVLSEMSYSLRNFVTSLNRVVLDLDLNVQKKLLCISRSPLLEFSNQAVAEFFAEELLELIPGDPLNLIPNLRQIENHSQDLLNRRHLIFAVLLKLFIICDEILDPLAMLCFNYVFHLVFSFVGDSYSASDIPDDFWVNAPTDVTSFLFMALPVDLYSLQRTESVFYVYRFLNNSVQSEIRNISKVLALHWCYWFIDEVGCDQEVNCETDELELDTIRCFVVKALGGQALFDRHLQANYGAIAGECKNFDYLTQLHCQRKLFSRGAANSK